VTPLPCTARAPRARTAVPTRYHLSEHGEVNTAARMTAADAQFYWMSAKEDLRRVDAAVGTPESWRAAPALDIGTDVAEPSLHGREDGCMTVASRDGFPVRCPTAAMWRSWMAPGTSYSSNNRRSLPTWC
jgi:hypothetical protein